MDAVQHHATRYPLRFIALLVAVIAAALLAGGVGGYVVRATTSSSTPAIAAQAPPHTPFVPYREHLGPMFIGPQIGHSLEH
jgi:hypothetical protein